MSSSLLSKNIEIKSRMGSGNGCHYSVQKFMSSSLLSKNIIEIKMYRTIILSVVLLRVWNLVAPLEEESSLRVLENKVLRRIFGPK
jgi:hypothetical protein